MKLIVLLMIVIATVPVAFAQDSIPATAGNLKTFTLTSPYAEDGHGKLAPSDKAQRNCFDMVIETEVTCGRRWDFLYGNMRVGEDWDWFFVSGDKGVRTKIVSLGKKDWTDLLKVPVVEPYPLLKPGEQRSVMVDASGADGAPGNTVGNLGDASSSIADRLPVDTGAPKPGQSSLKPTRTSSHYTKVEKGRMYVIRVVDETNDFYVLMRVDDLVRGRTATISWQRVAEAQDK
jgi:hypothetical protein